MNKNWLVVFIFAAFISGLALAQMQQSQRWNIYIQPETETILGAQYLLDTQTGRVWKHLNELFTWQEMEKWDIDTLSSHKLVVSAGNEVNSMSRKKRPTSAEETIFDNAKHYEKKP